MSEDIPFILKAPGPSHYYGDTVRILFVVCAVLIIAAQFIGSAFLTPMAAVIAAVILAVAAGLTNPVQAWTHTLNSIIAALGAILCGYISLAHFEAGEGLINESLVLILALVFLVALYLSIKTLRGALMRNAPIIK